VGNRTGPFTLRSFSLARAIKSAQTKQRRQNIVLKSTLLFGLLGTSGFTLLDVLDVARGKGDADSVNLGGGLGLLGVFVGGSFSDYLVNNAPRDS
jgi:hypothetical protein